MDRREFLTTLAALTGAVVIPPITELPDIIHADLTYCHVFSKPTQDFLFLGMASGGWWLTFEAVGGILIKKTDQLEVRFTRKQIRLRLNNWDIAMFPIPAKSVEIYGYKDKVFSRELIKA